MYLCTKFKLQIDIMIRYLLTFTACFVLTFTATAQDQTDNTLLDTYNRLFSLHDPDSTETFYNVSSQLQQAAKQEGNMDRYYSILVNEIVYEAGCGQYLSAIRKAHAVQEEIKNSEHHGEYYNYVCKALGSIFEHRGNYQMANHYYEKALSSLTADKDREISEKRYSLFGNLYSSLARVNIVIEPDSAWHWNEQLATIFGDNPFFVKPYLAHKAQIYFYKEEWDRFLETKREYDEFIKSPTAPQYLYGETKLDMMENIVKGNYDRALFQLDSMNHDDVTVLDAAIRIHKIMGREDLALEDASRRIYLQDSLNDEFIDENLNALNVTMGMTQLQMETARERERLMAIVIALLVITFALFIWRYITRNGYMKRIKEKNDQLKEKNDQLEVALDRAQESDRMKASFIQLISHEMRTPLNIITGFVQIISNPDYEVTPEERTSMLQTIDENTVAMANIINNLLEVSMERSKERYQLDDQIDVNDFCRYIMTVAEERNRGRLELYFETSLPDGFTIQSNRSGIEHIIRQVYGNSLKFTDQGHITFSVCQDASGKYVHFIVTDTGIGIPEELHEKVFEQFYKVDTFKQGLGIGLPMSRNIATLLGGTLTIDKTYRNGTRMTLAIPS